jgi:hypothetical protein
MSVSSAQRSDKKCDHHPDDCVETSYITQKTINTERVNYCNDVYVAAGEVSKWETTYDGETKLYNRRKCMFILTESNFQRYRNTEITLGAELMQTTDLIKDNVKTYIDWGAKLSGNLKDIFKKVKEVKAKMSDLVEAACKLENSKTNSCFNAEWFTLTGNPPVKCGDEPPTGGDRPNDYPEQCKDIDKTICEMICMPRALNIDINSIFKSSSDIIGIQIFSNISTLDPIQKTLAEKAKAFDAHLQDVMKTRDADMKKQQESLVKSVQETIKATASLYGSRSSFEGLNDTTQYFCCPECGCVSAAEDNCIPRLHNCESKICDICREVKDTFCSGECADEIVKP